MRKVSPPRQRTPIACGVENGDHAVRPGALDAPGRSPTMTHTAPPAMRLPLLCTATLAAALASLGATAAPTAPAASAASAPLLAADSRHAVERCQAAVAETVRDMRGQNGRNLHFTGTPQLLPPTADQVVAVTGEGRYGEAGQPFRWNCSYELRSGSTSGVVFRDTGAPITPKAAQGGDWQPDLSHIAPDLCEGEVATLLKRKHPHVGRIVFNAETRRLQPADAAGRVLLRGGGEVQPALDAKARLFGYECTYESASGRLVAARATD